jgi:xanthosine utilization system XapX-like protein
MAGKLATFLTSIFIPLPPAIIGIIGIIGIIVVVVVVEIVVHQMEQG